MSDDKLLETLAAPIMFFLAIPMFIFAVVKYVFLVIFTRSRVEKFQILTEQFIMGIMFVILLPVIFFTALGEIKEMLHEVFFG